MRKFKESFFNPSKISCGVSFILFLTVLLQINAYGHYTCSEAVYLPHGIVYSDEFQEPYSYWITFEAIDETCIISVDMTSGPINNLSLYSGICGDLTILRQVSDTGETIFYDSLTVGNYYYVCISIEDPGEPFNFTLTLLADPIPPVHLFTDCLPGECNNIIYNPDFEVVEGNLIFNNTCYSNMQKNPFYLYPFQYNYALVPPSCSHTEYGSLVCQWKQGFGSPQISQTNPYSGNYSAYMWAQVVKRESIYQNVKIIPNKSYNLKFWYKLISDPGTVPSFKIGFTTDYTTFPTYNFPGANFWVVPNLPTGIQNNWTQVSINFNAPPTGLTPDLYNSLVIFPEALAQIGIRTHFNIDKISITPNFAIPVPVITGPVTTCNSVATYTITNYVPGITYYWGINGTPSIPVNQNTFTVDWSSYPGGGTITVKHCEGEGQLTVYPCCIRTTDYSYIAEAITTPTTFNNKDITINDHLIISANVTINNSLVNMGPMARINVMPGCTLTIDNTTVREGCNYIWDGIYAEDPTAVVIIRNNSILTNAKNAVVSANNGKIDLTNSTFVDNITGVLIRQYNPDCTVVPGPPFPPPPDPHSAYIAGCTFELNSSALFPTQESQVAGIRVDTVYKLTIGDDANALLKNHFIDLVYGVWAIRADIKVINAEFNHIGRWTVQTPYPTSHNRPLEGAIHCTRPLNPAGEPSSQLQNSCIGPVVEIGGPGLQANNFYNCKTGIYAYKCVLTATYNSFEEQLYNAVFADETAGSVNISHNDIAMADNIWAPNKLHDASILLLKATQPFNGIATEVIGNTIYNTRTGIYVVNHTSGRFAECNNCTKIGANQIYFNGTMITDGQRKYCGISVSNCDRARVAGNHVENQATNYSTGINIGFPPPEFICTGISVAQCKDAWVYDNHQLVKLSRGIYAVGVCTNTQFHCNDLVNCRYGIYFHPNQTLAATFISHQGHPDRASDNYWLNNFQDRVGGQLNIDPLNPPNWYFRGIEDYANNYSIEVTGTPMFNWIIPQPNTNVLSYCAGLPVPEIDEDADGYYREQRYGEIVREAVSYDVLEEEFEEMNEEYLFEVLYTNPDIMNLGEPEDTIYQRFYNYRVNSVIAEFIEIQELIDEGDVAAALLENGAIVAQTVIDVNRQVTNDAYLKSVAEDCEIDETTELALWDIAMLTPYVGGEGVYAARVMLGIDPEDYQVPYRKPKPGKSLDGSRIKTYPNPAGDVITFELNSNDFSNFGTLVVFNAMGKVVAQQAVECKRIFSLPLDGLRAGVYFYQFTDNKSNAENGRFIKY